MATKIGERYVCKKCGSEFIVTRPGKGELTCCGQPMELKKPGEATSVTTTGGETMNQLGKRYRCEPCSTEVLCTKAGTGPISCCNQSMKVQEPRPLPSSD